MKYTLVQHTGWVRGEDWAFKHAVEEMAVPDARTAKQVQKAGGVLFDSYEAAYDAAERVNYQPDNTTLLPKAPGTFARVKIEDCPVYVPASTTVLVD